jgi:hypothetical protein
MNNNKKLLSEEAISAIRSRIPTMSKDIHEGIVSDIAGLARDAGSAVAAGARVGAAALARGTGTVADAALRGTRTVADAALRGTKTVADAALRGTAVGAAAVGRGTRVGARATWRGTKAVARVVGKDIAKDIIWKGFKAGNAEFAAQDIADQHQQLNRHQHTLEQTYAQRLGMSHGALQNILANAPDKQPITPNLFNLPPGVSARDLKTDFDQKRSLWNAKVDLSHSIAGLHAANPDLRRTANFVNASRRSLAQRANIQHQEPWWTNPQAYNRV